MLTVYWSQEPGNKWLTEVPAYISDLAASFSQHSKYLFQRPGSSQGLLAPPAPPNLSSP